VAIVVRSLAQDAGFSDTSKLSLVGDEGAGTSGYTVAADARHFLRKQYTETFQIRNRVRS
jgi:hypothetical protein